MNVLVACEFSGTVRRAFRALGHNAWSCDLLPAEDGSEFHYQIDVRQVIRSSLTIAHPPCTRLCNSGVRWLAERNLWAAMNDGAMFFKFFLAAPIQRIAVENPVMHKYAREIIGRGPDFTVQPWQFGDGEVKRTCFWTKNLPPLQPTRIVEGRKPMAHHASPGPDRWKVRSKTYNGIAKAMAEQWGSL